MADIVTEKSLVEEEKRIKGAVDHNIKMQVEKKYKRKVGEETLGSGSASVAPPGALDIESGQKTSISR